MKTIENSKIKLHFQRFEFKYYLPKNKADKIIPALLNYMDWDPYIKKSEKDFYEVNSLYFDSHDFGCFWDKESGIADRKKLRIRYYSHKLEPDLPVFVEIKRKKDALVVKDRVNLKYADFLKEPLNQKLISLLKTDPKNKFINELIWFESRNVLRPKLFITYKRKALVSKRDNRFRVTFDYDIKTKRSSSLSIVKGNLKEIYPEGVVLELKYNNILPNWFHKIIQKYQLQRLAYSKYCNSLKKIIPQLDDNNYIVN